MGKLYTVTPILTRKIGIHQPQWQEEFEAPQLKFNYLSILLKFYSLLSLMPYSCTWNGEENSFYLKSSVLKKILTGILHVILIIPSMKWAAEPIWDLKKNAGDVTAFFRVFDHLASFIMLMYMVYFVWRKQSFFIKFINNLFRQLTSEEHHQTRKYSWLMIFFLANGVAYSIFGSRGLGFSIRKGKHCAEMVVRMLGFYTTPSEFDLDENNPLTDSLGCWPFYISCLYYAVKYLIAVATLTVLPMFMIQHGLIMGTLLGVRLVWRNFKQQIGPPGLSFERGLATYSEIRRILNDFNELFIVPMFFIYLTNLTFIAEFTKNSDCRCTTFQNMVGKADALSYLTYTALIWWISSEIHYEIQVSMRQWMYSFHHRRRHIYLEKVRQDAMTVLTIEERIKLLSFMTEIETDSLGVSCKFFTISYSSFGSMMGLVITYGLVVHQFNYKS